MDKNKRNRVIANIYWVLLDLQDEYTVWVSEGEIDEQQVSFEKFAYPKFDELYQEAMEWINEND